MLEAITILVINYALHVHAEHCADGELYVKEWTHILSESVLEKLVVLLSALSLSVNKLVVVQ